MIRCESSTIHCIVIHCMGIYSVIQSPKRFKTAQMYEKAYTNVMFSCIMLNLGPAKACLSYSRRGWLGIPPISYKESLAHFGFFRGLKWYLFGFFRPLKSGEAFLEFSGALNDYMWAFSGAWNDTLLAFSGPWNWKSLFGVFRSLKWLYLGIFRGLKRHLIGWKRWCSDSILKQAQLEVPHSEMQVDLDS